MHTAVVKKVRNRRWPLPYYDQISLVVIGILLILCAMSLHGLRMASSDNPTRPIDISKPDGARNAVNWVVGGKAQE